MVETVIAFVGMALLVSLFLAFVVLWGRRSERRETGQHGSPAPPVRRRRPIVSKPLRPDAPAPSRLRATLAPLVRTASDALHRISTPSHAGAASATVQDAPADDLPHSPEELYQLTQAILHKQRGMGKAEAIERSFGVKKGGNPKYQRISRMFDMALDPPSPYKPLTEEQRRTRQALGLDRA